MMERGTIIACDLSGTRLRTAAKLLKGRLPPGVRLHLISCDASQPLPFQARFDRVLLDVPCSGTGTLARNPEIKLRLQPADLTRLAEIQKRMLRTAVQIVAPRGRLVYATCSLELEENERVVEEVLGDAPEVRLLPKAELAAEHAHLGSLFDERGHFRTRPDVHDMDGFFAAVIVRSD
jgi:16S rRNA (cytosine967-C5)-methyltransferase